MFLLLFGSLNGGGRIEELGGIRYISSSPRHARLRGDLHLLHRARHRGGHQPRRTAQAGAGTPLPPWVYITARIGSAVWFSMVSAVVMVVAAVLLFRVEVIGRMLPASVVTLLLGAACFCALGMAVAAVIPNGEAAP